MKKITYEDVSLYTNKKISTVKSWRSRNPDLLEIVKLGSLCKKNGLDIEKIQKLVEMQEAIAGK